MTSLLQVLSRLQTIPFGLTSRRALLSTSATLSTPPPPSREPRPLISFLKYALPAVGITTGAYYLVKSRQSSSSSSANVKKALNGDWVPFQLDSILPLSPNVKTFRFKLPEGVTDLGLPIASCVISKFVPEGPDAKPIIRPYTPIEYSDQHYFDLIVKKYPGGD